MKLQLAEVYTRLRVVSRRKAGTLEIDVEDIFRSSEEDYDPLVLIEGSPGIGKTTFCLKLAHEWANGELPRNFSIFKLVFLLKCRDMEGDIFEDVLEDILSSFYPKILRKKTKKPLSISSRTRIIRNKFSSFLMAWTSSQKNRKIV